MTTPSINWTRRPRRLRAPAMVCAFGGWNDAGEAASIAASAIVASFGGSEFAEIDLESFVDLRETRPIVRLTDGEVRELVWPSTSIAEVHAPRAPRDLIVVTGPEPALAWRSYCRTLLELADTLECSMIVTIGAFLADQPHTRPIAIAGTASDPALADRVGLIPSNYEGPTGITAAVHAAAVAEGIPTASLWAAVPHYIAAMPNPKAALALIRRLESLTGVMVDATTLEDDASRQEVQVEQAVSNDTDLRGFVEQLEEAADEEAESEDIPSGDSIARDLQRFLSQQDPDEI